MRHLIALTAVMVIAAAAALPAYSGPAVPGLPLIDGTTLPPPAKHATLAAHAGNANPNSTTGARGSSAALRRPPIKATASGQRFNWADAGIGAAAGAGVLLALLGAAALLSVRRPARAKPVRDDLSKSHRGRRDAHRSAV